MSDTESSTSSDSSRISINYINSVLERLNNKTDQIKHCKELFKYLETT